MARDQYSKEILTEDVPIDLLTGTEQSTQREIAGGRNTGGMVLCSILSLILVGNMLGIWLMLPKARLYGLVNRQVSIVPRPGTSRTTSNSSAFGHHPGLIAPIGPKGIVPTALPIVRSAAPVLPATPSTSPLLAFPTAATSGLPLLHPDHPTPPVLSRAAYLLDADTGQVLYSLNANAHLANASTTKIMTAIVTLEHTQLTDVVQINDEAANIGESTMGLKSGERVTVQMLLYGLLLNSGNDAAVALASYIAGSQEAFARLMNAKASSLGLQDTHFTNPHGLDDEGHYTSAHDLAIMALYAMNSPVFSKIVATRTYTIPQTPNHQEYKLVNVNQFLWWYPGADGVKPGFTYDAGQCQVVSARRHGRHLIAVVMHTLDLVVDTRNLMNWGFSDFSWASPRDLSISIPYDDVEGYFNWDTFDHYIRYGKDTRYYTASGYYVAFGILDYYSDNGGPAQFGLPRSRPNSQGQLISQVFDKATLTYNSVTHKVQVTPLSP